MARGKSELKALAELVRDFTGRRVPFLAFHHAFIESFVRLPTGAIARKDQARWHEAYELVLRSVPDREDELRLALAETLGTRTALNAPDSFPR